MRRPTVGVALAAVLALTAGCDGGADPRPYDPDPVVTTTEPAPDDSAPDDPAAGLTGVWGRSTDTMEVDIRFLPDGRYRSVEIYTPLEAGGVYQLQRVEDGVVEVDGEHIRLVGRTATLTRTATDDSAGDYSRPTPTRTGSYEWQLDGEELHLTDADGKDAVFTRQQ